MRTEAMSDAEWHDLKNRFPVARQCERCNRWLYSAASIARGYGPSCALKQALEALSYANAGVPTRRAEPVPVATFTLIGTTTWEMTDNYDHTIGHIRQIGESYWIEIWGDRLDFDKDLERAKRRALRIFEHLGATTRRRREGR